MKVSEVFIAQLKKYGDFEKYIPAIEKMQKQSGPKDNRYYEMVDTISNAMDKIDNKEDQDIASIIEFYISRESK